MKQQLNALCMFTNKDNISNIGQRLVNLEYVIYGSQGTARAFNAVGISCVDIATIVGDPLINHKVVSLSREIHAGLLAETMEEIHEIEAKGIIKFDLVLIDLYPLEKTINTPATTVEEVRKQTDIGGPTAASSAAKGRRAVGIEVWQREKILDWLEAGKPEEESFLNSLEAHVNYVVSRYRGLSAKFMGNDQYHVAHGELVRTLKYGENPHQKFAGIYAVDNNDSLALHQFKVVYGKADGYINAIDFSRAMETVVSVCAACTINRYRSPFVCVGVKHGNACGVGVSFDAYPIEQMLLGDLDAIMGGIIACNFHIDSHSLETLFRFRTKDNSGWRMLSGILCPSISDEALTFLKAKLSPCVVVTNSQFTSGQLNHHSLNKKRMVRDLGRGTVLIQDVPQFIPDFDDIGISGKTTITSRQERIDLLIAWAICANSNSNTITIVRNNTLLGNGVGQQSRVRGTRLAILNAKEGLERAGLSTDTSEAVAWSDSFFPFTDSLKLLNDAGIKTIGGTLGSKNDEKIIKYCEENAIKFYSFPDAVGRAFSNH